MELGKPFQHSSWVTVGVVGAGLFDLGLIYAEGWLPAGKASKFN